MSIIMKLMQARNVEQIAEELEPLAVSLATLADQAQTSIKALEDASFRQAQDWRTQQEGAATEVAKTLAQHVKALQQAMDSLNRTAEEVQKAQRDQLWTLAGLAGVAGIVAAELSIVLWLWLAPEPQVQPQLNPKAVAEYLKPAILNALKNR